MARRISDSGWRRWCIATVAALLAWAAAERAEAGSIYLTGHDVLFHNNQNGYSNVILDFLRGAGTASEIAAGSYDIGLLRSDEIFGSASTTVLSTDYGSFAEADPGSFATGAAFATFLGTIDVLVIASHTTCGGCDLTTEDSDTINSFSSEIQVFFNDGGDIWANSGANLPTYYDFLPPGVVATGAPIAGSTGFTATAAGTAIGIANDMINGFATHNRFPTFASAFTVFETRDMEAISIGVRDAAIIDDDIVVGPPSIPEPSSLALFALGLIGLGVVLRCRSTL